MDDPSFDLIKKKTGFPELKQMIDFAEKNGIDISKGMKEVKKAISVAEQVASSKVVDEFITKAKREIDRMITDLILKHYYDLETEVKRDNITDRQVGILLNSSFSAIGIKHYELALADIQKCRAELDRLRKPKYERGLATEMVKCATCMGKVKVGLPILKCVCGKIYHEPCATRVGKCECGVDFK